MKCVPTQYFRRRRLSLCLLVFVAAALSAPLLHAQTTIIQDKQANSNFPGTNTFVGWGVTVPHGTWNNIQLALYSHSGAALSAGTLYLLSQPFTGNPADLNTSVTGFVAASTGVTNGYYVYDSSVTLQPNTTYYFYAGSGFQDIGNDTGGSRNVYISGNAAVAYIFAPGGVNYQLQGTAVYSPPTIAQSFTPTTIAVTGSSVLSFTITNPNATQTLTGVGFTDTLPSGLVVSTPNGLTGSCGGGTITATAGTGSLSLSGATLAASGSCTFGVNVTAASAGVKANTTSIVASNEGGDGGTASASLNVNKLGQSITFSPLPDKTYGASNFALSATATSALPVSFTSTTTGVCTVSSSTVTIIASGSCSITASQSGSANYNAATDVPQAFTVNKAPLTVTANPASIAYGASFPSFSVGITGFVRSDTVSVVSGTPAFSTNATLTNGNPNAGSWSITPAIGSLSAANYTFSVFNNGTLTVSQPALTVTANPQTITYGAASPSFTATVTGFVNGDTSALVTGSANFTTNATLTNGNPNAGSWTITPALGSLSAGNYTFGTFNTGTLTVNKPALTVTTNPQTITYGTAPSNSATITGFVNGDTAAVVSGSPGFSSNATLTNGNPNAGSWTVTPALNTLSAANYTFSTFNGGSLTVNTAGLTVAANPQTISYGASFPTFTANITGFVNGDTSSIVSGSPSFTNNATLTSSNPNAGSWTITPALGNLSAGSNYTFSTFNSGALTVNKVGLTVTANPQTITYGAAFPSFTGAITGFVNGDNSSVVTGAAGFTTNATTTSSNPNAGSWTITPAVGGLTAANYNFSTFNTATLTVNKVALTVTADAQTVTYGAGFAAFTATLTGFVNGDNASAVTGSPAFSSNATTTNSNPNAGSWTLTPALGSLTAANYTFGAFNTGALTVNKATLTVTVDNASKVYGAVLPSFTAAITGFVNSDTQSVVSGSAALSTTATASSSTGPYQITAALGSLAAANYTFTFAPGTLTINKASTTTTLNPQVGLITATVAAVAPGAGTPAGSVQFLSGVSVVGTVSLAGGTATLAVSPGTYTANYTGDGNFLASTAVAATVYPPPVSTVSCSASPNPARVGQPVSFIALITTSGGIPSASAAGGTVQFTEGTKALGSGSVAGGQASLLVSALTAGSHTIVAQYGGDGYWPAAQASCSETVMPVPTVTLTATPSTAVIGQAVALKAMVTAPSGTAPTGQVTFSLLSPILFAPPTVLGTATLASGAASITVTTLPLGTQNIIVQYPGDTNWTSASASANVTVAKIATITTITLTKVQGQLTLTGTVSAAPGTGIPTGSVQFVDQASGVAVTSATLANGNATAVVADAAANTVAGRAIAAVYSGDATFQTSTSAPLPALINSAAGLASSFAPSEIVSLFGIPRLNGDISGSLPLPTTLGGVTVTITDSTGATASAPLLGVFASAGQINLLMPASTAPGLATITITLPGGSTISTFVIITAAAPGLFTNSMTGQGPFAGQILYFHADGTQTVATSPASIKLGVPGDQVFLVLYGTGIRGSNAVTATINGTSVKVAYAGAQGSFPGLDQINLGPLPATLAGSGAANIVILEGSQIANTVTATIQ